MGTVTALRKSRSSVIPAGVAMGVSTSEQLERLATANLRYAFAWQRVFLRTALALVVLSGLSGCNTLDLAADGIKRYCAATTEAERDVIRARFNWRIAPNEVLIYCVK